MKTSFRHKLLLIFFGLLLTVVILEVTLRIAGAIVLFLQDRQNHVSFSPNEYRILCLGESTTALGFEDSYPSQLEVMLNAQRPQKKFTVINKGIVSITTEHILTHIDQNLDKYKPQLVILMMGINDKAYMHQPYKALWRENIKLCYKNLRVYKLVHLLHEHIAHRIKEIEEPADEAPEVSSPNEDNHEQIENFLRVLINKLVIQFHSHAAAAEQFRQKGQTAQQQQELQLTQQALVAISSACVQLAQRYRFEGTYEEAQKILEQAIIFDPNDPLIYQEWGELYLAMENYPRAIISFQMALTLDPKNTEILPGLAHAYYHEHMSEAFLVYAAYLHLKTQDYWGYIELAQWLREYKQYTLAEEYLDHAMKLWPDYEQAYIDFGQLLDDQGQYDKEEAFYLNEITLHPKSPRLYQALGQFYQRQGKPDQSKDYFQKAALLQQAGYYPATLVNYSLILNKILNRHISVMVMQYPVKDIGPLKDYLGITKGVFFVENRQNFKEAIAKRGFSYYFKDNFAYDFGHCTRAGNELIARNLTDIILKQVMTSDPKD